MDEAELDAYVSAAIARAIRERGVIPRVADVATELGRQASYIDASFARLAERRVFIARKGSHEIHAYNPFCAERTDFLVHSGGRKWWSICGWDALGVPPALGTTGTVDTHCGDCGEPIHVDVGLVGDATSTSGAVLQVGLPAREFWKDIYFT
jgi:hypothetical protein